MRAILSLLLAAWSSLAGAQAVWHDSPVPHPVTRALCEQSRQLPARTYKSQPSEVPTRNLMACYGVHHGRNDIVDACLRFKPDLHRLCYGEIQRVEEAYPLDYAAAAMNPHAVTRLLAHGADARRGHPVQQMQACAKAADTSPCVQVLKALVRAGADIDDRRISDLVRPTRTLFSAQSSYGSHAWLSALLAAGADVNAKDHNGCTALDTAIADNRKDVEEFLRSHGGSRGLLCPLGKLSEKSPLLMLLCIFGC